MMSVKTMAVELSFNKKRSCRKETMRVRLLRGQLLAKYHILEDDILRTL